MFLFIESFRILKPSSLRFKPLASYHKLLSFIQENICGIITALSHRELVVRTATGVRFNVLVGQLRTGRVILSKDRDTAENAVVFQTAADMQNVRDKYYKYSS